MKGMTTGSPLKNIVLFSIPLIIGNFFQLLYNMVDSFIVGRTLGVNALAGLGASGSLMFFIIGFSQGFTSGLAIPTAQAFGAEDYQKVRRSVIINWVSALSIGLILTIVSVYFLKDILIFMNTPVEIIDYTYDYLKIVFGGMLMTILYNMLSNLMRALGDSRTPLYFLVIAMLTNIVLDYVFIVYLQMGTFGAGFATIISQGVAVVLLLWTIQRKWPLLQFDWKHFRVLREELFQHWKIGLPMAFQSSIIAIGSLSVTFALNQLGPLAVAGFTASQKIDQVVNLILMSFGVAMATYVGQNFGAGKFDRIKQGVRSITFLTLSVAIIAGIVLAFFGGHVVTIFADGSSQADIFAYGQLYFRYMAPFYWLLSLLFIYRFTLQGLGDSLIPTVAGIMELIMRVIAAFVLSKYLGFIGIVLASPLAWIGAVVPLAYAYHKRKNLLDSQHEDQLIKAAKNGLNS